MWYQACPVGHVERDGARLVLLASSLVSLRRTIDAPIAVQKSTKAMESRSRTMTAVRQNLVINTQAFCLEFALAGAT